MNSAELTFRRAGLMADLVECLVAAKLANLRDGQRSDLVEGLPIGRASELTSRPRATVRSPTFTTDADTTDADGAAFYGGDQLGRAAVDHRRPIVRRRPRRRILLTIQWSAIVGAAAALGGMAARVWFC